MKTSRATGGIQTRRFVKNLKYRSVAYVAALDLADLHPVSCSFDHANKDASTIRIRERDKILGFQTFCYLLIVDFMGLA